MQTLNTSLDAPAATGTIPVFVQIAEHVARGISAGHWPLGSRLPPERELAAQYDVAVGTIRKALARLTEMGLLERRQGSGNYVKATENSASIYAFFRLELPGGGGLPSVRVLSVDTLDKPDDLPAFGSASKGHRVRRLRFLDDVPAALEEIWLDGSVTPTLPGTDLPPSLYHYYREVLGLWITKAEDWLSVAVSPDWATPDFGLSPGASAGYIERFGQSQDGQQVEFSRTWFDPDRARYVARLA